MDSRQKAATPASANSIPMPDRTGCRFGQELRYIAIPQRDLVASLTDAETLFQADDSCDDACAEQHARQTFLSVAFVLGDVARFVEGSLCAWGITHIENCENRRRMWSSHVEFALRRSAVSAVPVVNGFVNERGAIDKTACTVAAQLRLIMFGDIDVGHVRDRGETRGLAVVT